MEDRLSSEELAAILEAREQKQHAAEERGAKQLVEILTRPQSGMSRTYTFDMLADAADDDRPPAA